MPFFFWGKGKKRMQIQSSQGVPIFPGFVAQISTRRGTPPFGAKPFGGLSGGCGCGPVGGCGCGSGLSGLAQSPSLDQIISNTFSWLGGTVESSLPTSAAIPPQVGSTGALLATLQQWLPYIIGGYLIYKVASK
jgi:hypothetical protein